MAVGELEILEALPLGVQLWEATGADPASLTLRYANPGASDQSGFDLAPLVGSTVERIFPGADAVHRTAHRCAVEQEEAVFDQHYDGPRSAGWWRVTVRPVGGRSILVTYQNVTAGKALERALRQSDRTARAVVGSLQEGVVVVDAAGVVLQVNDAVSRLCRADVRDLVGRSIAHLPITTVRDPGGDAMDVDGAPIARALRGEVVRGHLAEVERLDGSRAFIEVNSSPLVEPGEDRPYGAVSTYVDVTERVERERRIRHEADHDPLTGLANRRRLLRTLDAAVARARRHDHGVAALAVDLDGFKAINDRHGHAVGDEVLREVAGRLRLAVRERDLVSRPGGDEFVVVLVDLAHAGDDGRRVRDRVELALKTPVQAGDERIPLDAAVGLACFPGDAADASRLLDAADRAMYARKRGG